MRGKRRGPASAIAVSLAVFALLFSVGVFVLDYVDRVSGRVQTEMVRNAVRNAVLTCYAVEGVYPPDIGHLVENYGLAYDDDRYLITYDAFASNVLPEIRVEVRGGERD